MCKIRNVASHRTSVILLSFMGNIGWRVHSIFFYKYLLDFHPLFSYVFWLIFSNLTIGSLVSKVHHLFVYLVYLLERRGRQLQFSTGPECPAVIQAQLCNTHTVELYTNCEPFLLNISHVCFLVTHIWLIWAVIMLESLFSWVFASCHIKCLCTF